MQLLGAASLFLCVTSMVTVLLNINGIGTVCFVTALILMGASLSCLLLEIWCSGGALQILLNRVEGE
jgi:hypothetical protein